MTSFLNLFFIGFILPLLLSLFPIINVSFALFVATGYCKSSSHNEL